MDVALSASFVSAPVAHPVVALAVWMGSWILMCTYCGTRQRMLVVRVDVRVHNDVQCGTVLAVHSLACNVCLRMCETFQCQAQWKGHWHCNRILSCAYDDDGFGQQSRHSEKCAIQ